MRLSSVFSCHYKHASGSRLRGFKNKPSLIGWFDIYHPLFTTLRYERLKSFHHVLKTFSDKWGACFPFYPNRPFFIHETSWALQECHLQALSVWKQGWQSMDASRVKSREGRDFETDMYVDSWLGSFFFFFLSLKENINNKIS